jgi:hypothetical protein
MITSKKQGKSALLDPKGAKGDNARPPGMRRQLIQKGMIGDYRSLHALHHGHD